MSDEPLTPSSAEDDAKLAALFEASRDFVLAALKQVAPLEVRRAALRRGEQVPELNLDDLAAATAIGVQFSVLIQVMPTYTASLMMQTPGAEPRVMLRWVARIDPSEVH